MFNCLAGKSAARDECNDHVKYWRVVDAWFPAKAFGALDTNRLSKNEAHKYASLTASVAGAVARIS